MAVRGWDGHLEFLTPVCVLVGLSMTVSSSIHPSILNTENVFVVAFATSCTCNPSPRTSGSNSIGGNPGSGISGPACQDFSFSKAPITSDEPDPMS